MPLFLQPGSTHFLHLTRRDALLVQKNGQNPFNSHIIEVKSHFIFVIC